MIGLGQRYIYRSLEPKSTQTFLDFSAAAKGSMRTGSKLWKIKLFPETQRIFYWRFYFFRDSCQDDKLPNWTTSRRFNYLEINGTAYFDAEKAIFAKWVLHEIIFWSSCQVWIKLTC